MLSKLVPDDEPIQLLRDAKFSPLGFGIARWNGEGDPPGLLRGLRDGRYVSHTRGAFFYVLRKLVPMKADDSLPAVTRQEDAGQPRLGFAVPEPFLHSALRRWDGVPQVTAK